MEQNLPTTPTDQQQNQECPTCGELMSIDVVKLREANERLLQQVQELQTAYDQVLADGRSYRDYYEALQKEHTDLLARYNQQQTEATKSFTDRARLRDELQTLEIHSKANEDYIEWLLARPLWQRITNRR